jgi:hypothetical protein
MEDSLIDDDMKGNWEQIHQKINVPAEVMKGDFISVDSDVAIIQEATADGVANSIVE